MGGIAVSDGPTLPSTSGSSWKLARGIAEEAQGLVTSGFGTLPAACALLLSAGTKGGADTRGGAWIDALQAVSPVTDANAKTTPSVALALTSLGLVEVGLHKDLVDGFARPFVDGMMQEDRRRRLGDVDEDGKPFTPVLWGLRPKTEAKPETNAPGSKLEAVIEKPTAELPIHALLLVYHETHPQLIKLVDETIVPALTRAGMSVARRIALDLGTGNDTDAARKDVREHFGFVDGISQPIPYGAGTLDKSGKTVTQDPLHGVPLGEILLGYPDAHGTAATGPLIAGTKTADGFVPSSARPADATVQALRNQTSQQLQLHDLTLNGSYLVVRELRQDVDAFWASMKNAADELNASDPGKPPVDAAWVAERVIGRTRDGHMLRPEGPLPPLPPAPDETEGLPNNDFLFFQRDRHGYGCPLGSHVRRSNPRDGLAYASHVCEDLLRSANAHRILRRGRKFGPDIGGPDSTTGKGLLFICLNGDIARQFEFVQQNWLLNPNFATLYDEVDPLVGPKGQMTLPAQPLRRRVGVETFVTLVGGDYFFLPSLSTLRILAALRPEAPEPAANA